MDRQRQRRDERELWQFLCDLGAKDGEPDLLLQLVDRRGLLLGVVAQALHFAILLEYKVLIVILDVRLLDHARSFLSRNDSFKTPKLVTPTMCSIGNFSFQDMFHLSCSCAISQKSTSLSSISRMSSGGVDSFTTSSQKSSAKSSGYDMTTNISSLTRKRYEQS